MSHIIESEIGEVENAIKGQKESVGETEKWQGQKGEDTSEKETSSQQDLGDRSKDKGEVKFCTVTGESKMKGG